jgi:cell wall-associated NlpC family hydrolase
LSFNGFRNEGARASSRAQPPTEWSREVPHHPGPPFSSVGSRLPHAVRRVSPGLRAVLPACAVMVLVVALVAGALVRMVRATSAPRHASARPAAAAGGASGSRSEMSSVPVARLLSTGAVPAVAPLGRTHQPDIMIVAQHALPSWALGAVQRVHGVTAAESLDAARIQVNGKYAAMLGVNPSTFRGFAAHPTAASDKLWKNVAAGGIAVSYTMGSQDHLPLGGMVHVAGTRPQNLPVGGFATVGVGGIDTVVSRQTAASLGLPSGNAIIVSAASAANLPGLTKSLKGLLPRGTTVQSLVPVVTTRYVPGPTGQAGGAQAGSGLSASAVNTMLNAALSRRGMPYVWGAAGPSAFDCSGLVQWSFAQAGITMPRVAADQALTGPAVAVSQLQPGDLLFWRTDPTAPDYISHVAIYLGNGWMIQAPQPGQYVEVVPVTLGSGFAGAVQVEPQVAGGVPG